MEQRSATSDTPTITDKCIVYGGMTTSFRLELREKGNNKTLASSAVLQRCGPWTDGPVVDVPRPATQPYIAAAGFLSPVVKR